MIQLVEITGTVNEKGCIEVPIILFEQTGIRTGEEVKLLYFSTGEQDFKNESREFMLIHAGKNTIGELAGDENAQFRLPEELLTDAGIPLDADLDIVCRKGKIMILPAGDTETVGILEELVGICEELGIPREKVNIVLHTEGEETDRHEEPSV